MKWASLRKFSSLDLSTLRFLPYNRRTTCSFLILFTWPATEILLFYVVFFQAFWWSCDAWWCLSLSTLCSVLCIRISSNAVSFCPKLVFLQNLLWEEVHFSLCGAIYSIQGQYEKCILAKLSCTKLYTEKVFLWLKATKSSELKLPDLFICFLFDQWLTIPFLLKFLLWMFSSWNRVHP